MKGPPAVFSATCSRFLARSDLTEALRRRLNSAQHLSCLTLQARCPQAELDLRAWRLLRLPPPGHSSPYRIRLSQVPGRCAGPGRRLILAAAARVGAVLLFFQECRALREQGRKYVLRWRAYLPRKRLS